MQRKVHLRYNYMYLNTKTRSWCEARLDSEPIKHLQHHKNFAYKLWMLLCIQNSNKMYILNMNSIITMCFLEIEIVGYVNFTQKYIWDDCFAASLSSRARKYYDNTSKLLKFKKLTATKTWNIYISGMTANIQTTWLTFAEFQKLNMFWNINWNWTHMCSLTSWLMINVLQTDRKATKYYMWG